MVLYFICHFFNNLTSSSSSSSSSSCWITYQSNRKQQMLALFFYVLSFTIKYTMSCVQYCNLQFCKRDEIEIISFCSSNQPNYLDWGKRFMKVNHERKLFVYNFLIYSSHKALTYCSSIHIQILILFEMKKIKRNLTLRFNYIIEFLVLLWLITFIFLKTK